MRKFLLVCLGMVAGGFVIGAVGVGAVVERSSVMAGAPTAERNSKIAAPVVDATEGEQGTNEFGLRYGSFGSGVADLDLIEAIASNGRVGYVYADELAEGMQGPSGLAPESAAEWKPDAVTISVYLVDGKTKIGDYVIDDGWR